MFLYQFVCCRCRHWPQTFTHAIISKQLFRFLSFLVGFMDLTIDYLIRFWLIFVVMLTLNFQGQIWNLLYLLQKWSDCQEIISKHIDRTSGLKCNPSYLILVMTLTSMLKVKFGICYISAKHCPIALK